MHHPGGFFRALRVDSHFTIIAEDGREHTCHVECQTQDDGSILFRIVEYDLTLAADSAAEREQGCEVRLPETGVIFLRSPGKKLKGRPLICRISNSRGDTTEQPVEAITVEGMSVPILFGPALLALLPFWLFTYTPERLKALQEDAEGHQKLLTDARILFNV